ncbi:hypothetical protein WA158_005123 [Blastocystis sp. Blastoise]
MGNMINFASYFDRSEEEINKGSYSLGSIQKEFVKDSNRISRYSDKMVKKFQNYLKTVVGSSEPKGMVMEEEEEEEIKPVIIKNSKSKKNNKKKYPPRPVDMIQGTVFSGSIEDTDIKGSVSTESISTDDGIQGTVEKEMKVEDTSIKGQVTQDNLDVQGIVVEEEEKTPIAAINTTLFTQVYSDNNHKLNIYTEILQNTFRLQPERIIEKDMKPLLVLFTYIPVARNTTELQSQKDALLQLSNLYPYIQTHVYTHSFEISKFVKQNHMIPHTTYQRNKSDSPFFFKLLRPILNKKAYFYGYISEQLLVHSSLIPLLMSISKKIEMKELTDEVFMTGKSYSIYNTIENYMERNVMETDMFIEKNTLFTSPHPLLPAEYFFFTSSVFQKSELLSLVVNRPGLQEYLLNIMHQREEVTTIDLTHSLMTISLIPAELRYNTYYKSYDSKWNFQKMGKNIKDGYIHLADSVLYMNQESRYIYSRGSLYDDFITAVPLSFLEKYIPSHSNCIYYAHGYVYGTLLSLCSNLYSYYYTQDYYQYIRNNTNTSSQKGNKNYDHFDFSTSAKMNEPGLCSHFRDYIQLPLPNYIPEKGDGYSSYTVLHPRGNKDINFELPL